MKVVLISTGSKNDRGPRKISNVLNKQDHKTEVIFYDEKDLQKILSECKNAGLIVVSANVGTHRSASILIKHLKKLKKPTAYAGIYPSLYPDECIKETDLVITGKSAETILELAKRLENFQRINDIECLLFKANMLKTVKNA